VSSESVPMAQTSSGAAPHTSTSGTDVPLSSRLQSLPSKCTIVPLAPTAQTSVAEKPHTE
jgi:hypothetical protein